MQYKRHFARIAGIGHRTKIVNHYIKKHHYDWEFGVLFEKEIKLHDRAQEKLQNIRMLEKETHDQQNFRDAPLSKSNFKVDEYRLFVKQDMNNNLEYQLLAKCS